MAEVSFRGGAQVGWVGASWPFARFAITRDRLTLSCLEKYEFDSNEVVSIESYGSIPILYSGIRINHNRADYPEKIIFWCTAGRQRVFAGIDQSGFHAKGKAAPRTSGFPFRWHVVIAVIAIWNVLFFLDGTFSHVQSKEPGAFIVAALVMVFVLSTAIKKSEPLQNFVLREGHKVTEVTQFLSLLQIVSGIMSVSFAAIYLARAYAG